MSKTKSSLIYILKSYAILFVIFAHSTGIIENVCTLSQYSSKCAQVIGTMGVPIFFAISGYLVFFNEKNFGNFLINKIKKILIPAIISGSIIYLYVHLRKGNLSVSTYLNFIIGNGSYLYFITLLFAFFILFYFLKKKNKITLIIEIMIFLLSLTNFFLNYYHVISLPGSPYLNPFYFIIYFLIGFIINKYHVQKIMNKVVNNYLILCITFCCSITLLVLGTIDLLRISYFSPMYLLFTLCNSIWLTKLSLITDNKLQKSIGKYSFSIYLYHMPFAGIVANLFNRIPKYSPVFIRPFIVLGLTYAIILLYKKLSEIMKIDIINPFLGIPREFKEPKINDSNESN